MKPHYTEADLREVLAETERKYAPLITAIQVTLKLADQDRERAGRK